MNRKRKHEREAVQSNVVATVEDEAKLKEAVKDNDIEAALALVSSAVVSSTRKTATVQDLKRWKRNWDAEWLVVGKNQIKKAAEFSGLGMERRCFDGKLRSNHCVKIVEVDRKEVLDDQGRRQYKPGGWDTVTKGVYEKRVICPKCGKIAFNDKGRALSAEELDKKETRCTGLILRSIDKNGGFGSDILYEGMDYRKYKGVSGDGFPTHARRMKVGSRMNHAGKTWEITECAEPLFQFHHKPSRWPVANIIQNKMRRWADYLVVDEAHQHKAEGSAQAVAMGKVLSYDQVLPRDSPALSLAAMPSTCFRCSFGWLAAR